MNRNPKAPKPLLETLLEGVDTTSLCDINKTLRVLSPELKPIAGTSIIGRARTVSVLDDFLTVIKALDESRAGEVLVIDGRGGSKALLGELFSAEAQRRGLKGIVVDGACRDVEQIRKLNFPVFARSHTPMAGTCKLLFDTQMRITCGGVTIEPGEIIFGDVDGIVVMSDAELDDLVGGARALQQIEGDVLTNIKNGTSLMDMTNARAHIDAVAEGRESKLLFTLLDNSQEAN